jgi:hypothetical protein
VVAELICRGFLDVIDDDDGHRQCECFQLQAKLLFEGMGQSDEAEALFSAVGLSLSFGVAAHCKLKS